MPWDPPGQQDPKGPNGPGVPPSQLFLLSVGKGPSTLRIPSRHPRPRLLLAAVGAAEVGWSLTFG